MAMKDFLDRYGYLRRYAYFSGGKDSLAMLLYLYNNDIDLDGVIYTEVTGNTHPDNISYAKEITGQLGYNLIYLRHDKDFFTNLVKWGIPWYKTRWCMTKYKIELWKRFHRNIPHIGIVGIKRGDSRIRREYFSKNPHLNKNIKWEYMVSPILNWSTKQVIQYIETHGIKLNPLYKIIYDSGNCMFCPFKTVKQIKAVSNLPEWRSKILNALEDVRELNKVTTWIKHRWIKYLGGEKLSKWISKP